jgi:GntR family transcriptional regulator, transcriptional repressor for pyruvate dehydrogenase complex
MYGRQRESSVPPGDAAPVLAVGVVSDINRVKAVDAVRARILVAIEHGLLRPGERLPSADDVASGMEVGAITARRALESLVTDGVLVRRRGRGGGTFVAADPSHVDDDAVRALRADEHAVRRLIDERLLMESTLTHLAAQRATDVQLAELARHVDAAAAADTWVAFHLADRAFPLGIGAASGCPAAARHAEVLQALYRYYVPYPIEHLHASNQQHRAILAALVARDPVAALTAAYEHVAVLYAEMFIGFDAR